MSVRAFVQPERAPDDDHGGGIAGELLELDDDESRYVLKVRRARVGDPLELLDGRGGVWSASLIEAGRRARVRVIAKLERGLELPERIVLLGLPDATATLDALTGASEMGATELVFVACERSQGHAPSPTRIDRVLRAAIRQCGRPSPPRLLGGDSPWSLAAGLGHRAEVPGLLGDPGAAARAWQPDAGPLRLLVGPEGGLTTLERDAAVAAGFTLLHLSPWILRTPTAVVAMLARAWHPREAGTDGSGNRV